MSLPSRHWFIRTRASIYSAECRDASGQPESAAACPPAPNDTRISVACKKPPRRTSSAGTARSRNHAAGHFVDRRQPHRRPAGRPLRQAADSARAERRCHAPPNLGSTDCCRGTGRQTGRGATGFRSADRFRASDDGAGVVGAPPTTEHLRLRIELSGGGCDELLFWDRRGLGLVRLVTPQEFEKLYGDRKAGSRRADARAAMICKLGWRPAGARSRWPCSISGPWPASAIYMPAKSCTLPAFIPAVAATACARLSGGAIQAADTGGARNSHPARRFDLVGRHLSQRAQSTRRLSEPSSGLRSSRPTLSELPAGQGRADRAGPAIDVFLRAPANPAAAGLAEADRLTRPLPSSSRDADGSVLRICIGRGLGV